MANWIERAVLGGTAVIFLGFGLFSYYNPEGLMALAEIDLESPSAFIEIRAIYGGMNFGLGALLLFSAWKEKCVRLGLLSSSVILGSIALGRILGLWVDGSPNPAVLAGFGMELAGAAITATVWITFRKSPQNHETDLSSS